MSTTSTPAPATSSAPGAATPTEELPGHFVSKITEALPTGSARILPIGGLFFTPPWIITASFSEPQTSITTTLSLPHGGGFPSTDPIAIFSPISDAAFKFTPNVQQVYTAKQINFPTPWNYTFIGGGSGAVSATVGAELSLNIPFPGAITAAVNSQMSTKQSVPSSSAETPGVPTLSPGTGGGNFSAPTGPTASPSPNSATPQHVKSSKKLSTGGIVGLAIGVAVACALVLALLAFCILRRRRNRRAGPLPRSNSRGMEMGALKTVNGGTSTPRKPILTATAMAGDIPQAADDKEVQQRTSTVLDQVDVFVQNFCQPQARSESQGTQDNIDLSPLATGITPITSRLQATQLAQSGDALPLIKHALAWQITAEISSGSSALLPEAPAISGRAGGSNAKKSGRSTPNTAFTELRDHEITKAIRTFNGLFSPWFKAKYTDAQRDEALRTIWLEASKVGTWLMNQPQELQFQWPEGSQASGQAGKQSLAVTPALVKITDDRGQRLSNPQAVVPATFG